MISIDFETYYSSEYGLKKLTTEGYVRDPRFQVIGVGVALGDRSSVWMEEADFRAWASRVPWADVDVLAHHAHFDGLVLAHHYGAHPRRWLDTLSMGRLLHGTEVGGSLAALSERYGIGAKGDEVVKALGKRRHQFSREEWLRYGAYCNNDVELTRKLFHLMRRHVPDDEIDLISMTVRMFTDPRFVGNRAVLQRALEEERARKAEVLARIAETTGESDPRSVLGSTPQFCDLLRRLGVDPPMKPNAKGEQIPALAKTDPGMHALLEAVDPTVRAVAEARLEVKSTIVESRAERMLGIASRGAVPIYLKYSGAHTHRWSGGDKMNPQNFNRGGALRAALEAPPGHVLVVSDSGQIEARVVGWVGGEKQLLETFRRNDALEDGDFYSDVGGQFFGKKLSKKDTPVERQVSKSMVLGLGFGMGWAKFSGELLKGMLGAPPVQFGAREVALYQIDVAGFEARPWGRDGQTCGDVVRGIIARIPYADLLVHCAVTEHFVRLYRTRNPRIAALWKSCEDVLQIMAQPPRDVPVRFGCMTVNHEEITKPSGLVMRYPKLTRRKDGWVYQDGREWKKAYGGLLTENIVQSLARDIVAGQALDLHRRGYHVATTTHDEIVCIVPEAHGEECLRVMLEVMRTPPAWCTDLPLNASGSVAVSYGDAK